MHNALIN